MRSGKSGGEIFRRFSSSFMASGGVIAIGFSCAMRMMKNTVTATPQQRDPCGPQPRQNSAIDLPVLAGRPALRGAYSFTRAATGRVQVLDQGQSAGLVAGDAFSHMINAAWLIKVCKIGENGIQFLRHYGVLAQEFIMFAKGVMVLNRHCAVRKKCRYAAQKDC